jgi:hypothetical protein
MSDEYTATIFMVEVPGDKLQVPPKWWQLQTTHRQNKKNTWIKSNIKAIPVTGRGGL